MCRIHGHLGGDPIDRTIMFDVAAAQRHGGPDDTTVDLGDGWALGNARLAVQGVDGGRQPFRLGPGLSCVYNGEIYNHDELRAQLRAHGHHLPGRCDGDVLLPLYERYGDSFVRHLSGMYAIAIVDSRAGAPVLKLFTDPAGMKSLYFYRTGDGRGVRFASELAALARFPDFPAQLDAAAVDRYLGGRAVWGPSTIYRDVHTLTPGAQLTVDCGGRVTEKRHPLTPSAPGVGPVGDVAAAGEYLHELLSAEMTAMLRAEVPVCVVTSGGLDSSYLTALAAERQQQVATFTIAYKGSWPADEREFAAAVAAHCRTDHTDVVLDPVDFPALIGRYVAHLDQPNSAPHSLSTFALFEAIRTAGFKVAITGDGADELFAGYRRFARAADDTSPTWRRAYQQTLAVAPATMLASLYSGDYRTRLHTERGGLFTDRVGDELPDLPAGPDRLEALLRYDQTRRFPSYILRRVDHLSMAHGVEARIPFLQPMVRAFAHQLPAACKIADGIGKACVVAAAGPLLPAAVLRRPKQPFTLPIRAMMTPGQPLHEMVGDIVLPLRRTSALFDAAAVRELFDRQALPDPDPRVADTLWALLVLETWMSERSLCL